MSQHPNTSWLDADMLLLSSSCSATVINIELGEECRRKRGMGKRKVHGKECSANIAVFSLPLSYKRDHAVNDTLHMRDVQTSLMLSSNEMCARIGQPWLIVH